MSTPESFDSIDIPIRFCERYEQHLRVQLNMIIDFFAGTIVSGNPQLDGYNVRAQVCEFAVAMIGREIQEMYYGF